MLKAKKLNDDEILDLIINRLSSKKASNNKIYHYEKKAKKLYRMCKKPLFLKLKELYLKTKIKITNQWKILTFRKKYLTPEIKKELDMWDKVD